MLAFSLSSKGAALKENPKAIRFEVLTDIFARTGVKIKFFHIRKTLRESLIKNKKSLNRHSTKLTQAQNEY